MNQILIQQLQSLTSDVNNFITNLANLNALIMQSVKAVDWVGFYQYLSKKDCLLLGPYQGTLACNVIPNGEGVCGRASQTRRSQIVPDVTQFKGHIACDSHTRSEIVVPMILKKRLVGVLDLDSNRLNAFDRVDQQILKQMVLILLKNSDIIF